MKSKLLLTCIALLFCTCFLHGQSQASKVVNSGENSHSGWVQHPWQGKKVGYIGDSITDPNCYGNKIKKYWDFCAYASMLNRLIKVMINNVFIMSFNLCFSICLFFSDILYANK